MENEKSYSQLRAMFAMSKAAFISLMRSPSTLAFSFLFPIVFLLAFGFIGGGKMKIQVSLLPGSDVNNPIYEHLLETQTVNIQQNQALEKINRSLLTGATDAAILISKEMKNGRDFYEVKVKTTSASEEKGSLFMLVVKEIVDQVNLSEYKNSNPIAELRSAEVEGRKYSMIDFILPGQIGFAVLSTAVFGTAFVFLNLRNTLVIKRFFATPIHRTYIILGEALARVVFSLGGTLFIIILGYYGFNFTLAHGVVTVINMTFLAALGLLIFMGIGFTISGVAKNESTVPIFANIVTMPQFMLSGTFFSVEMFPEWLQKISYVLPLTYLNNALRKVSFDGAGLVDVWKEILILVAWGVVIYLIAGKTFKWE